MELYTCRRTETHDGCKAKRHCYEKASSWLQLHTRSVAVQNPGAHLLELTKTDVTFTSVFNNISDYTEKGFPALALKSGLSLSLSLPLIPLIPASVAVAGSAGLHVGFFTALGSHN